MKKLRTILPVAFLLVAGMAYAAHLGLGNLSAIGWQDIAVLCPLGALGTMIASKTLVPHAVVSLAIAFVGIVLLGRAFCAWVCPVPLMGKLRGLFSKRDKARASNAELRGEDDGQGIAPLTEDELEALSHACHKDSPCKNRPSSSRHFVLGGALLSTAIFGFPVFCLICPIGLAFAEVFVLVSLFGQGDVTWSVLAIPAVLAIEVVFFRKWCSHVCPISSLMSLVGRLNRTLRPRVDHEKCLVDKKGVKCGRCAEACDLGIDPRHPEQGAQMHECTKCGACVDACPAGALKMPFIARRSKDSEDVDQLEGSA